MVELGASQRQDMDGASYGQTITRSIEGDIQTKEYRDYRGYLY